MRYSYHIWMLIIPLITKTDVKFMMLHNMVKGETRDTFTLRFINNPYNAFNQLDLGYRPRLYQIGTEGEENYNQIDARQVPSGGNVADEIFEDVAGNIEFLRNGYIYSVEIWKMMIYFIFGKRGSHVGTKNCL